ncbi:MAG TPA: nucleoside triphosphate pyrophosphohydrolase [Bacillota bacterium]|nr:nucleoside triphosphate pyrophosphohydrolase [Bacillota bacterium]
MKNEKYADLMDEAKNSEEGLSRLYEILKVLRKECPWDRKQTHESIRTCMIEEAYETVEAINNQDKENLREELGDVLLQVLFHASLAEEEKEFSLTDVINEECDKMIRRHPHVFSDGNAKTIDKVLEKWENIKDEERIKDDLTARLDGVPRSLPALIRSKKVQERAARYGFDWDDIAGAFNKISEETEELFIAYQNENGDEIAIEIGDLLFSVVNSARFLNIDPEEALNAATDKFIKRFERIEEVARKKGMKLEEMSIQEMDQIWEEAKSRETLQGFAHKRMKQR